MQQMVVKFARVFLILNLLVAPTLQQQQQQHLHQQQQRHEQKPQHGALSLDTNPLEHTEQGRSSVPYLKASIPMRIYECLRDFSVLRCTKLFVLQKMEEPRHLVNTGNLTRDFIEQFFGDEQQMGSLTSEKYRHMPEKELNQRLVQNFQRFFKNRDIKLHFLPGMLVKIVPSKENKLKFSLKKKTKKRMGRSFMHHHHHNRESQETDGGGGLNLNLNLSGELDPEVEGDSKQQLGIGGGGGGGIGHGNGGGGGGGNGGGIGSNIGKRKNKKNSNYKTAMLQMAVPILVMPAILLGSMLPFVLPALKMATIMSLLMNNGAFLAALVYAARTQVNSQDEQHISYGGPGGVGGYSSYH